MFDKSFWTGKNIIFVLLVIVLLFTLPKTIGIFMLFFGAYVLACALNPFVIKFTKKMSRTAAASLVMGLSVISVLALFVPIIIVAVKEIRNFMLTLPEKISGVLDFITNTNIYGHKIPDFFDFETLIGNSTPFAQGFVNHSLSFTAGIFQFTVIAVAITMIVYYILVDKNYLQDKFLQLFPPDMKEKASDISATISNKVGGYVRAQILSMVAVGVMVAFILIILGVEYSTLLGLISGILDIIPLLGPTIALGLILLVAYPLGGLKIFLIIIGFLIVQQISNYVVRPVLFGKLMELHPLMIFLALFLADQFLGFWGVILSPAIAATICVLIDELYIKPINLKGK